MSYNISTMYIFRYFNNKCECPICKIKQITERDIVNAYLSEAVMEDLEREKVNKYGFCNTHYDLLYAGRNKLGVALQISTRLDRLTSILKPITNVKDSVKQAKKLKENTNDCIICRKIEFHLKRYFETIPRLYNDDKRFRDEYFNKVNGFCMPHYIRLLENGKHAGVHAKEFLNTLYEIQLNSLKNLKKNVDDFTLAFDYRKEVTQTKESKESLKTARIKLYGDLPLSPESK